MVFRSLVKAILQHQRDPDNILLATSISSLKHEITHDLIEAFKSSSDLIKNNQTLFNESHSFLDFLTKICGYAPTMDYKEENVYHVELKNKKNEESELGKKIKRLRIDLQKEKENSKSVHLKLEEKVKKYKNLLSEESEKNKNLQLDLNRNQAQIKNLTGDLEQLKEKNKNLREKFDEDLKDFDMKNKKLQMEKETYEKTCHERYKKLQGEHEEEINNKNLKIKILEKDISDRLEKMKELELSKFNSQLAKKESINNEPLNLEIHNLKGIIEQRNDTIIKLLNQNDMVHTYKRYLSEVHEVWKKLLGHLSTLKLQDQIVNEHTSYIQNIYQRIEPEFNETNIPQSTIPYESRPMIGDTSTLQPMVRCTPEIPMTIDSTSKLMDFVINKYQFNENNWEDYTIDKLTKLENLVLIYDSQRKTIIDNFEVVNIEPERMAEFITDLFRENLNEFDTLQKYILEVYPHWKDQDWKNQWIKEHKYYKLFLKKYFLRDIIEMEDFINSLQKHLSCKGLDEIEKNIMLVGQLLKEFGQNNLDDLSKMIILNSKVKDEFREWFMKKSFDIEHQEWYKLVLKELGDYDVFLTICKNYDIIHVDGLKNALNVYKNSNNVIQYLYNLFFNSECTTTDWTEIASKFKNYKDQYEENILKLNKEKDIWKNFFQSIMELIEFKLNLNLDENLEKVLNEYVEKLKFSMSNPKSKRMKTEKDIFNQYKEVKNELDVLKSNSVTFSELKNVFYTLYHYYFYLLFQQRKGIKFERNEIRLIEEKRNLLKTINKQRTAATEILLQYVYLDLGSFPQINQTIKIDVGKDEFLKQCVKDTKEYIFNLTINSKDEKMEYSQIA